MRVMLLTGGFGLLGGAIRAHLDRHSEAGWAVVAPSSGEMDVRDADAVMRAVERIRPAAVVHTAYRREERDTIVDGSANMAAAAAAHGARLVHMSTDVVFAGRERPYTEDDPLDPPVPRRRPGPCAPARCLD